MYCKNCGKEISNESKFCKFCGGKLDEENIEKVAKKRKTLDQFLGINGLCSFAIISEILGGDIGQALKPIGTVAILVAVYYLIKKRKVLTSNQKLIGWVLVIIWIIFFSITSKSS